VSAHWEAAEVVDQRRFYDLTYETPDAGALANLVRSVLPDDEPVHEHASRGLDHGAWVPLLVMFPAGDIPVLQMSMPTQDPARLVELGRRLRPLREHGVLIVGSGFLTHGLPFLRDWRTDATPPGWSSDFDQWAAEALARGDVDELSAFADRAPGMPYAHPTVEHFTPLFITLGAASRPDSPHEQVIDGYFLGLAKRSFQVA